MQVGGTVRLGHLFGIRIGVSRTWFIVLFVVIYVLDHYFSGILNGSTQAFIAAAIGALLFFGTVVAHELGHALVARHQGMEVDGIDLWALGGFTRTRGEALTPGAELRLAAAGPLVNALVIAVCIGIGLAFGSFNHFLDVALLESGLHVGIALVLLSWLALINAVLLVFNLLPALPLDGGRIARAIAWQLTGDSHRATRACARLGQLLGGLLVAGGVVLVVRTSVGYGLWFCLIGLFITQAARQAWLAAHVGERIRAVTVEDVMDPSPLTVPSQTQLLEAKERYFSGEEGVPWLAVTDDDGRYRGLLLAARVEDELRDGRPALTAGEISIDSPPWRIDSSATLEAALRSDGLRRLGAIVAVDGDGILRGIVTLPLIHRAMHPSAL
ncbi:MAG: site-2 protease family protein [Solirubrobacteraceae bacterium]